MKLTPIKSISFKPELNLIIYNDNDCYWSTNNEEQGEWDCNGICINDELYSTTCLDDAEEDIVFQTILCYAYECVVETWHKKEKMGGMSREDEETLDRLYHDGEVDEIISWRYGSLDNAIKVIDDLRSELAHIQKLALVSVKNKREREDNLDRACLTYRFKLDEDEVKYIKVDERYSFICNEDFIYP